MREETKRKKTKHARYTRENQQRKKKVGNLA
jgi:hypothetical protein